MALLRFSLDTMKNLDFGRSNEAFADCVRRAVLDCINRPGLDKARTITLSLKLKPVAIIVGNSIDCDGANGVFQCKCAIPDLETKEVNFGVQRDGNLIFQEDSPRDHHQQGLEFDEAETGDAAG